MNVNMIQKTKKFIQLASLMKGPLNFMYLCSTGKFFFVTEVRHEKLNDKHSD